MYFSRDNFENNEQISSKNRSCLKRFEEDGLYKCSISDERERNSVAMTLINP